MSTTIKQTKNTVPVGKTPVPKYATWDEHRDAMRQEAEALRAAVERERGKTATNQRYLT